MFRKCFLIVLYLTPTISCPKRPNPSRGGTDIINARSQTAINADVVWNENLLHLSSQELSLFLTMINRITANATVLYKEAIPGNLESILQGLSKFSTFIAVGSQCYCVSIKIKSFLGYLSSCKRTPQTDKIHLLVFFLSKNFLRCLERLQQMKSGNH